MAFDLDLNRTLERIRRDISAVADRMGSVQQMLQEYIAAQRTSQESNDKDSQNHKKLEVAAEVRYADAVEEQGRAENKKSRRIQLATAIGTWSAVLAASVYAGIAAYQACQMRIATVASQQSVIIARKELELSERPWIAAEVSLVGPLVFDANGAHVTIRIDIKNVGHSVALNVMPDIALFGLQEAPVGIRKAQKRICSGSNEAAGKTGSGYMIFPGVKIPPIYLRPSIDASQIRAAVLQHAEPGTRLLDLHLLGCISYNSTLGKGSLYQTGIAFEVAQADPAHPGAMLPVKPGQDISLATLRLFSEFLGAGSYAQ